MSENLDENNISVPLKTTTFDKTVRVVQLTVGVVTWFALGYGDYLAGVHLVPFTFDMFTALAPKYAIPWAIMHGFTGKEIIEFTKAWRNR